MKKTVVFIFIMSIAFGSCKREFGDYYDAPKGMQPSIYKQLEADARFSTFVSAIDKVPGLKEELSSSGLFTVMAPDNDAFTAYFAGHSNKTIDEIPADSLAFMVKFHILKWMFFETDFLNPGLDLKSFSLYKYLTRANFTFKDVSNMGTHNIFYPSKMTQVYTPSFQNYYNVTDQDLAAVYGASFNNLESSFHVLGATVKKADISSGNGVIHIIDRVLLPPCNVAQELQINPEYSDLYNLLSKRFISYKYNSAATIAQGNNGDINGDGMVDSLWDRAYTVSKYLDDENPVSTDTKTAFSITAYIPAKPVFDSYMNSRILPGFGNDIDSVPSTTLLLLFKAGISEKLYWPSQINSGQALTVSGDKVTISTTDDVNSIKMKSNGLFYELNTVQEPPIFNAVGGPALLKSKYSYFGEMLYESGAINQITFPGAKFTLLCPTNKAFERYGYYWDKNSTPPAFYQLLPPAVMPTKVSATVIKQIVQSHLLPNLISSQASLTDGFYPTNNATYIQINGGKINGAELDTIATITEPDLLMSNGYFHGIDRLLMAPSQSIYTIINSASAWTANPPLTNPQYTKFKELVAAAGMNSKDFGSTAYGTVTSADANKKFTLFVPSNAAITAAQVAGLLPKTGAVTPNEPMTSGVITNVAKRDRLAAWLRYFFVADQQIFTDGKTTGEFTTAKKDPLLYTPSSPIFVKVLVSYSGGQLHYNQIGGSTVGNVDVTQPLIYPQNKFATDGVVLIIDNAFTSQY